MHAHDITYATHILITARKATQAIKDVSRNHFDSNEILQFALTHMLQIIGEAARHISKDFQNEYSHIPWLAIIAMRHKVVHDYMNVDLDIVWETLSNDLPILISQLEDILKMAS